MFNNCFLAFESRKPFHLRKVLNEYASGGFIQATGSTDSKCKKTFLSAGFPANMCSGGNDNYFYKIMLSAESDSCTGGIIEYFGDSLCSEYLGTSDLDEGDFSCKRSPNFFSEGDSTFVQYSCSKYAMPTFTVASGVTE